MKISGILWVLTGVVLLVGCRKEESIPSGKRYLKTKYIYASSKDKDPYAYTNYYYDGEWHLTKEIVVVKPDPITFKNTYKYQKGKLIEKSHFAPPQGSLSKYLTEENLVLYDNYIYSYPAEDLKIEKHYDFARQLLEDSAVYEYEDELLLKETHYRQGKYRWGKEYVYDRDGNKVKETEYPEGIYTLYFYKDGKKTKAIEYNKDGSVLVENDYVYKKENGYDIQEVHYSGPYGKFISFKSFFKNGLLVEEIRYHPTFIGAEWACYRYEYY